MKHFLFIAFVFLSTFITASAQDLSQKKEFQFGIKYGLSFSDLKENRSSNYQTSLYAGLQFIKSLSNKYDLQVEANYSKLLNFHFVEVPVLLKYNAFDAINMYGGIQLDFPINDNNAFYSSTKNKFVGASLILGLEYKISKHWFIEARYAYGVTDNLMSNTTAEGDIFSYKRRGNLNFGMVHRF